MENKQWYTGFSPDETVGQLVVLEKYKFVDPKIIASVVRDIYDRMGLKGDI